MKGRVWVGLWLLFSACPAWSASQPHGEKVGASVEELLDLARRLNPELAAAALETEAAQARAAGADALPDPKFTVAWDEITQNASGWPGRMATIKYSLQQEIPGWGKRETKRQIAEAEGQDVASQQEDLIAEVVKKVKTTYADYHRVHLSMDQTNELIQILRALTTFARAKYGQGMAQQADVTSAEAERGALSADLVRLEKERHRLRSRLNALVNRPPNALLVEHPRLRPIPPATALTFDGLRERTLVANPGLRMNEARWRAAEAGVKLAEKNWLPDWEVGFGVVERRDDGVRNGYEAMASLNLPLPWTGGRQALEREAVAKRRAAGERLTAERLRLESGLREAILGLEEAREVEKTTREVLLPQARIAMHSAIKGYETGVGEAMLVLDAIQRLKKFQIELLKAQFEQQVRLAEVERLIGGEL
ncbi:MAG: TolC family protein [Magnetococcales bacterium]|nr:TolC family protein [Magnetococcales bacterium]